VVPAQFVTQSCEFRFRPFYKNLMRRWSDCASVPLLLRLRIAQDSACTACSIPPAAVRGPFLARFSERQSKHNGILS